MMSETNRPPIFKTNKFHASIRENNRVGDVIATVTATDPDGGVDGEVTYRLDDNRAESLVGVHRKTGTITAKIRFDREENDVIEFEVFASDGGSPSRSASARVVISIADEDDELPQFTAERYIFHVQENNDVGLEVGSITAVDRDSPPRNTVFYALRPVTSSGSSAFQVNHRSGQIFARVSLDRETISIHDVPVLACPSRLNRSACSTAHVIVYVDDVNDNPPVFVQSRAPDNVFTISNDHAPGSKIVELRADDKDIGPNARINFKITSGNGSRLFAVHSPEGLVVLKERLPDTAPGECFNLHVEAFDQGTPALSDEAIFIVCVAQRASKYNHGEVSQILYSEDLARVLSIALVLIMCTIAVLMYVAHRIRMPSKLATLTDNCANRK